MQCTSQVIKKIQPPWEVVLEAILLPGPDKSQVDELIQPKDKLLFSGPIDLVNLSTYPTTIG